MKHMSSDILKASFDLQCSQSVIGSEWTIHQLAPYIGKIKSSIAKFLIENFTQKGDTIYDPFCGAGTIPFEAWALGRNVIANDLNTYAYILTKAKLNPPSSNIDIYEEINNIHDEVTSKIKTVEDSEVPAWVRDFFHPGTLKEILSWIEILKKRENWFLLSCLLGILHHQRPGFLSFPSSHTVPYLRLNKFPSNLYPELYQYRDVRSRLMNKVKRALKRHPSLDFDLQRVVSNRNANFHRPNYCVDAVITSPPYMRKLDYARDNRLRLWFLGISDYKRLDEIISPKEVSFIETMQGCLNKWDMFIKPGGRCILFLGDNYSKKLNLTLPGILEKILFAKIGNYKLIFQHDSIIPNNRRVRRNLEGNKKETVLVFQKMKS